VVVLLSAMLHCGGWDRNEFRENDCFFAHCFFFLDDLWKGPAPPRGLRCRVRL
jgi:hypothetical protein